MNKSELKSGLTVVQLRNGGIYYLINNNLVDKEQGFMPLNEYNDDLTNKDKGYIFSKSSDWDIVKIAFFQMEHCALYAFINDEINKWNWQREEIKEVTMDEVEAMFKCKVKIKNADKKEKE